MNLCFRFFLLLIPLSSQTTILTLPYQIIDGAISIEVSLGTTVSSFWIGLDQSLQYSWTSVLNYNAKSEERVELEKSDIVISGGFHQNAILYKDTLNIVKDKPIKDYYFYVVQETMDYNINHDDISFGYKFKNESFSFIHLLYNNKYIDYKSYAIEPVNDKHGNIYIGGVPEEVINNFKVSNMTCDVNKKHGKWGCKMEYVFFGDISYTEKNEYYANSFDMHFQAIEDNILAPLGFMIYLYEKIFEKEINKKECTIKFYKTDYIECKESVINKLNKDWTFVFGNNGLKIQGKKMFKCDHEQRCKFLIMKNPEDNSWVFGGLILLNYLSIYDYEESKITLYSKEKKSISNVHIADLFPFEKLPKIVFIVISIGLGLIILKVVYTYYKERRFRKLRRASRNQRSSAEGGEELEAQII